MNVTNADYFTFNIENSLLLVGQTNSGKSFLEDKLLDRYIAGHKPDELQFVFLDMTQVDFYEIKEKHPEYIDGEITFRAGEGLARLDELAVLSTQRIIKNKTKPMLFICIEECDMAALDQERFDRALIMINQNAEAANMKVIYSTSRPSTDTISNKLKNSFDVILAGCLASRVDEEKLGAPNTRDFKQGDFAVIYPKESVDKEVSTERVKKRILCIEDDPALVEMYKLKLEKEGFVVGVALDGEEGLSASIKFKPDLIITGILMPKISGFDVLENLKKSPETKHIPVVILSAIYQPEYVERAMNLGAANYLDKNRVFLADVVKVIRKTLQDSES